MIAIRRDLTEMDLVEAPRMLGKKPASCLGDCVRAATRAADGTGTSKR
jgi:hypothetical protein